MIVSMSGNIATTLLLGSDALFYPTLKYMYDISDREGRKNENWPMVTRILKLPANASGFLH